MMRKGDGKRGFTLIELISVIAILAVLLTVSVPAVMSYIEAGRQANRESVARTLYLAAQNRLTGMKLSGGLDGFSAEFYDGDELKAVSLVYTDGVVTPDAGESAENRQYVRYISKSKGAAAADDPVVELLSPLVMDKSVFENAILVEYNIKTGVVLSVFYSDIIDGFSYSGTGGNEDVSGSRPYYEHAARRQGYYGVGSTGQMEKGTEPLVVNLYDGAGEVNGKATPLDLGGTEPERNVLYAEIFVHQSRIDSGKGVCLQLCAEDGTVLFQSAEVSLVSAPDSAQQALSGTSPHIFYKDGAYASDDGYSRYVWVIDYVGGDMTATPGLSAGVKYGAALSDYKASVRAGVCAAGDAEVNARSVAALDPYYSEYYETAAGGVAAGACGIKSARHLYNMRYAPGADFVQLADVDMDGVTMAPLGVKYDARLASGTTVDYSGFTAASATSSQSEFSGSFTAAGHSVLDNMKIKAGGSDGSGLFGAIGAEGEVTGLIIRYAGVQGDKSSGVVCGVNRGTVSAVTALDCTVSGTSGSGGIAGANSGRITDVMFIHYAAAPSVGGSASGGIVAANSGTIARAYFLAVAPADASGTKCCPITCSQSGTAENVFYLSGQGLRPEMESYNRAAADVGEPLGTEQMYAAALLANYKRLTVADPLQLVSTAQGAFPYAFWNGVPAAEGEKPFVAPVPEGYLWPVVKHVEETQSAGALAYYEMYVYNGAETYGLYYYNAGVLSDTIKTGAAIKAGGFTLVEAGYGVLVKSAAGGGENPAVSLKIADAQYDDIAAVAVDAGAGAPEGCVLYPVDQEKMAENAEAAMSTLTPSVVYMGNEQLAGVWCVPNFARGVYTAQTVPQDNYVRTMRQLRNITPVCGERVNYWQELDIDAADTAYYTGGGSLDKSAVDGEFKGVYSGYYNGGFNGGADEYHVISGLTFRLSGAGTSGLFSGVSGEARYVRLTGADIRGSASGAVGGVAGEVLSGGTLYGCTVDAYSNFIGVAPGRDDDLGGVAGTVDKGAVVENCFNAATMTRGASDGSTGGVAGTNEGTLRDCYNAGSLRGYSTTGGVVGYSTGKIENCYNASSGTVYATYRTNGTQYCAGGVAGYASGSVRDSYNLGSVTGNYVYYVGGVCGEAESAQLNNCFSSGTVGGYGYVGGVCGRADGSEIYNCFNEGSVSSRAQYSGGVAGAASGTNVSFCYNSGTVSANTSCGGGIAGYAEKSSVISCSSNYGRTTAGVQYAGGIVGQASGAASSRVTVTQCGNYAGVSASADCGGVAGYALYADISDCMSSGTIGGTRRIGGLAGSTDAYSTVKYCYTGSVVNYSSYYKCGDLVGSAGSIDNIRGCFGNKYWANIGLFGNVAAGTTGDNRGVTTAELQGSVESIATASGTKLNAEGLWTDAPNTTVNGGCPVLLSNGYTGDTDAPFSVSGRVYTVSNAYQLNAMRDYAASSAITFRMDRNIYLGYAYPGWVPEGTAERPFAPAFDGGGYTVSGLSVVDAYTYSGLFGYKSGGDITDLGVTGSVAGYGRYAGAIAGYSTADISGCRSCASVNADTGYAGGVVGRLDGAECEYLYNNGTVSYGSYTGGAAGYLSSSSLVHAYGTGGVYSYGGYGGGVAGYVANDSDLTDAYCIGYVAYNTRADGSVGYGDDPVFDGGMLWHFGTGTGSDGGPKAASARPSADTLAYFEVYTVTAPDGTQYEKYGYYYYVNGKAVSTLLTPDGTSTVLTRTGYGVLGNINGNSAWVTFGGESLHKVEKTAVVGPYKLFELAIDDVMTEGAGLTGVPVTFAKEKSGHNAETVGYCVPLGAKGVYTAAGDADTVYIRTAQQLKNINYTAGETGVTYVQELDLDLSASAFTGAAVGGTFAGTYDGGMHSVAGLTVNADGTEPVGLFGTVSGEVSGLYLRSAAVTDSGSGSAGAVAGAVAEGGKVSACSFESGTVTGSAAGGIAGRNAGTISECRSFGAVNGAVKAGGIAGENSGAVTDCYNTGAVASTGTDGYAGGIAGENTGTLAYCYSTGAVAGVYSGGLAGKLAGGSVEHAYSAGSQTGANLGGISGYMSGTPSVGEGVAYLTGEGHPARDHGNVTDGETPAAHGTASLEALTVWGDYQARPAWENGGAAYPLLTVFGDSGGNEGLAKSVASGARYAVMPGSSGSSSASSSETSAESSSAGSSENSSAGSSESSSAGSSESSSAGSSESSSETSSESSSASQEGGGTP